jgi:hypothetical protein
MNEQVRLPGDFVYDHWVRILSLTEYGTSFNGPLTGAAPPSEGARFDIHVEGTVTGPTVKGKIKGVDYINVRADGRLDLDFHAGIIIEDGKRIALAADDVVSVEPRSSIAKLRANVTLTNAAAEYSWVNRIQFWAPGSVDFGKGRLASRRNMTLGISLRQGPSKSATN